MANEEHKFLSQYIKEVHLMLRRSAFKCGANVAWQEHCANADILTKYAQCMQKLATTHWESNCNDKASEAKSRIKWAVEFCLFYFVQNSYKKYSEKEILISQKINVPTNTEETFTSPIKLLDVGSCYNPFQMYDIFDVYAIDLCPANASVLQCDFLKVNIGSQFVTEDSTVTEIPGNSFNVVTFCFLLEYLPSSDLRILACEKAYSLLKPGGLLIINTPDSKHVGANSKIMKCWRYTLALIGFNRIKYEKLRYMHCMAFRKSLNKNIAMRWASMHKEPYMKNAIHIPQDFSTTDEICIEPNDDIGCVLEDFQELAFGNQGAEDLS